MSVVVKVDFKRILATYSGANLRLFRAAVQIGFSRFLCDVKTNAVSELLPGPRINSRAEDGIRRRTRREVYAMAPTTPGRLTNRTGRLARMLADGNKGNIRWVKFGGKNINTDQSTSKSFHGTIKQSAGGFVGKWSPYVRDGSPALNGVRPDRVASLKQSLAFRASWEHGLKGKPPRRFLTRAYEKIENTYSTYSEPFLKDWVEGRINV